MQSRDIIESDLDAIVSIEKEAIKCPWTIDGYKSAIISSGFLGIVAVLDEQIVGYITANKVIDEVYINNIAVAKGWRRRGIADKLLCDFIERCEDFVFITLEVRESNISAQNLYKKHGFNVVGMRPDYYKNPEENALLMSKIGDFNER